MKPDLEAFLRLPTEEVAQLVREAGPKVCVFPINGTRRWFVLEHGTSDTENFSAGYLDAMTEKHIELYRLFFDHGVDTLLTPIFGPDLLERGDDYVRMAIEGMARLGTHPDFLAFYTAYGVRVRCYGDYPAYLDPASSDLLSSVFSGITRDTLHHNRCRLFFGIFAHDAAEAVARTTVDFYRRHGAVPDRRTLVESYYGEYVAPVDFFIGFGKFSVFDMPLVSTGEEDLYFTVAPSPCLTARQLRTILYDHIYFRPANETDYSDLTPEDRSLMREFYLLNLERTQGVGARQESADFWYPLPQVRLPMSFTRSSSQETGHGS
jgi:tuberculosinol/isotuberculosinol synthase